MENKKSWFINQYSEIHDNLSRLEKQIQRYQNNKSEISSDPLILENLKIRVKEEIERLNKTREYERKLFNY
jgi:hypothetical protein